MIMGAKGWVAARSTEHVESQNSLENEGTPKVHGKIGICGGLSGNEMVLECADCAFSCVSAVDVGRGHLESQFVFLMETCFERW